MPEYSKTLFSAGCDAGVVSHCEKVAEVAARYVGESVDSELVHAGAMLHDIGRSKTHSIKHAAKGAKICRRLELSEDIVKIVGRHTGAGLTEDESVLLSLSPVSVVPETLEEKIVAHADNLVSGSREVTIYQRMMQIADLPAGSKRKIWRLSMEVELLAE
ncbi:metal dependent phosphohydrolase [Methanocorpusculum labreanum Z]|uniref:Metal dependent phosphohydrolase n=1 Tax=Methanocorpusculum labreanum (strain ATCC 43576 / DSM 4855 / Z) TaxID=410358 RepID=A2SQM7_METLZ|nr:HDIG domain-containing metalloprotein [Methanocorpusculum labreanum]ABN06633.1 metal dependent phosphohydrolase [Methanocorpusculum labreanum Z]